MIFTSISRAIMGSFAMFPTVFETYESASDVFGQKNFEFPKDILIPKFVIDTIN